MAEDQATPLDEMTMTELRALASDLDIGGRSSMNRQALEHSIRAVRDGGVDPADAGAAVRVTQNIPDLRVRVREGSQISQPDNPDDPETSYTSYTAGQEFVMAGPQAQMHVGLGHVDIVGSAS